MANTTELSMCGGNVAFFPNYFDHLLYCLKYDTKALLFNMVPRSITSK